MVNRMACFTLPEEMFGFYKTNIDYLINHSVDPDKRRYADANEPPRHYLDVDHYGEHPFDSLPEKWKDAVEKFGEDSLKAYGIVPWHIGLMFFRLTNAFKEKNEAYILYLSGDIGHYIADAHVPLHCTENYNGQLTGQNGIHGFWESRLPEIYGEDYDYLVGKAEYIDNVTTFCWKIIKDSYAAHDSVLQFEKSLNSTFSPDQKYAFEFRNGQAVRVYSDAYSNAYHNMLGGQVERRMQAAIVAVGSLWYSAWVNAGMPVLQVTKIVDDIKVEETLINHE
jgi:hypothetical protein